MKSTIPTMVQVYDKEIIKEYYKVVPGLFWSYDELIRTNQISSDLIVRVDTDRPINVIINGKKYIEEKVFHNNPQSPLDLILN